MKRTIIVLTLLALIAALSIGSLTHHTLAQGAQEPIIPLEGLDPVLLTQGKEVLGKPAITSTRGRFKYVFATEENKAMFEKQPERYEIQLGGTCARMGPQVGGNADLYSVHNGRIYIFGSGECQKRFEAAP
jgi:YHS domain-containing protein